MPKAQEALWEMLARGVLQLLSLDLADVPRMRELMSKYADRAMDLADAALVRAAEREGIRKIYALQGKSEEAIDCLDKAMTHAYWYKRWAQHDADLDSLRSHPRFQTLMER